MTEAATTPLRDRVITAAGELFYAEGYGVTIDAVTVHAGVAKPTVYVHFGSKEGLIEATLWRGVDEFFTALASELALREGDPIAQLLAPFDLLAKDLPDPEYRGCRCINAAASFPQPDHPAHTVLRSLEERLLKEFERLSRAAGVRHPVLFARQLLVLFDGVKARGLTDSSDQPAKDAKTAARALVGTAL